MALVNIPRDRDDPNYRYKMPRLQSKIEGRGNGIRTNISNMGEIARALKRPPMYPTKFFGCELGAMAKYEDAEEKALINGAHSEKDLVVILDKFIEMYVLCHACRLPEMDIAVKKNTLVSKCNACGLQAQLDMAHKAATYMIRNPPNQTTSTMGKKKKGSKDYEKHQKDISGDSNDGDDVDKKDKKKKEKKKKKLLKKGSGALDDEEVSDSEKSPSETVDATQSDSFVPTGHETISDDKRKKKRRSKTTGHDGSIITEELTYDSPEIIDAVDRLQNFLKSNEIVSAQSFFEELRVLQVSQSFDAKCRIYVTLLALFESNLTLDLLDEKMAYVQRVVDSSVSQGEFIQALERYCYFNSPCILESYPYVIKKLYDAEILDSGDILEFYDAHTSNPEHEKCSIIIQPFLQWLRDTDSDVDDDEANSNLVKEHDVSSASLPDTCGSKRGSLPNDNVKREDASEEQDAACTSAVHAAAI